MHRALLCVRDGGQAARVIIKLQSHFPPILFYSSLELWGGRSWRGGRREGEVCVVCGYMKVTVHVWRSDDNFWS